MGEECQTCGEKATGRCGKCFGVFCGIHMIDAPHGYGTIHMCLDCANMIHQI